jgi:hypothetical protein
VRGWEQVAQVIEHAASLRRDDELVGIEIIAQYVTADLGYVVDIERATAKIGSREDITPYALRATNIFRCEEGGLDDGASPCRPHHHDAASGIGPPPVAPVRSVEDGVAVCGGPLTACVAQAYQCRAALRRDEGDRGAEWRTAVGGMCPASQRSSTEKMASRMRRNGWVRGLPRVDRGGR